MRATGRWPVCHSRYPAGPLVEQFLAEDQVPCCPECGSELMKHATVSFGQALDTTVLRRAAAAAEQAQLLLAMGSSLVVEPAASLPRLAKQHGARLVIINRDPTPLDDQADLVLHAPIGESLSAIDTLWKSRS
jgi:NAD-dependent deacetylase